MKQQSGSKRLSTFARYVVSYMLVLLLALSALFLYMYVYMNREVRAQVISNGINRLSRIAYQHEGYLDNMLNTAEQIGLSPYLQPFSYRDEPWRAYELMQQLIPYTVSNDFSDQMYLCFASDDYLYSSSSMMTLDMFSSLMHYEHVSGAELMRLIRQPGGLCVLPAQKVASSLLGSDQYDVTTFIIPLGMSQKSERGSMLFLLRQNTYQQLFSDAIAMNANTCILHLLRRSAADWRDWARVYGQSRRRVLPDGSRGADAGGLLPAGAAAALERLRGAFRGNRPHCTRRDGYSAAAFSPQ